MELKPQHNEGEYLRGVLCGLGAYAWWGVVVPLHVRFLRHVNVFELLAHRILWSLIVCALLLTWLRAWQPLIEALKSRRTLLLLLGSTIVISFNWMGFIWAVYTDRLSHASLGYYINPLVSVLLGFIFLGERLRRPQQIALVLATVGVVYLTLRLGQLPWIALVLAFSFGFYGLFRKLAHVDAIGGLFVECAGLSTVGIGILIYLEVNTGISFGRASAFTNTMLVLAGVATATPLVLFSVAARRLPLATVGFLQYSSPSMQLVIAVIFLGEAFTVHHGISFAAIWTALAIYTVDLVRQRRSMRRELRMSRAQ